MSKKSFLLGLGLGLLLATLILQIEFWQKEQTAAAPKTISLDDLRQEATKFGYELYTPKEIIQMVELKAKEMMDGEPSSDAKTNSDTSSQVESTNTQSVAQASVSTQSATKKATDSGAQLSSVSPPKTDTSKRVTIMSGWNATQVANYLYKQGIVKDEQELVNALISLSATRQISSRAFNLEPDSDAKSVAEIITVSKPKANQTTTSTNP